MKCNDFCITLLCFVSFFFLCVFQAADIRFLLHYNVSILALPISKDELLNLCASLIHTLRLLEIYTVHRKMPACELRVCVFNRLNIDWLKFEMYGQCHRRVSFTSLVHIDLQYQKLERC